MKNVLRFFCIMGLFALLSFTMHASAFAQDAAAPALDSGSTAWMMVATLLVLMMTLPGLALFYGGMVHKESVLATLMQCFVATTLVTILWMVYGYSMIFTENTGFIGGAAKFMLAGVGVASTAGTAPALVPETVFIMFQLTFAIITCALIFGSV